MHVGVAEVPEQASMAGEEDGHAFQPSHHTRSSSVHVLRHRSLLGAVACAVDTPELPTVVASSLGLAGTSFRGDLGEEGSRLRGP